MQKKPPLWKLVIRSPVLVVATGFGAGLSPFAPGTAGSLMGWLTYDILVRHLSFPFRWITIGVGFTAGVWACAKGARELQIQDPPQLALDEVIAMWLILSVAGRVFLQGDGWVIQTAAFALFRLFDIVKRGPVGWVDHHVKGGFGIMLDDVVAAALTIVSLYAIVIVMPWA